MIRVLAVDLPQNKRVIIGLQYIYGIGPTLSAQICKDLNIADSMRVHQLTPELVTQITDYVTSRGKTTEYSQWKIEGELKRWNANNITRLQHINCRRGTRLRARLPVHGQRTKSNARVAKGKAGATAIRR